MPAASVPIRFPSTTVPAVAMSMPSFRAGPIRFPGAVPGVEVRPPITVPGEVASLTAAPVIGSGFSPEASTPNQSPSTVVFVAPFTSTP